MIGVLIIKIIHLLLLLFIIFAPFYGKELLLKSIILLCYIYYKWKIEGSCFLTKLEYFVSGKEKEEEGFIYRLINPLFNLNESKFSDMLDLYTFYWIVFLIIIYLIRYV
jgi:hypothetical protein